MISIYVDFSARMKFSMRLTLTSREPNPTRPLDGQPWPRSGAYPRAVSRGAKSFSSHPVDGLAAAKPVAPLCPFKHWVRIVRPEIMHWELQTSREV